MKKSFLVIQKKPEMFELNFNLLTKEVKKVFNLYFYANSITKKTWYRNNSLHRVDGPAKIENGNNFYFLNGIECGNQEYKLYLTKNGLSEYGYDEATNKILNEINFQTWQQERIKFL